MNESKIANMQMGLEREIQDALRELRKAAEQIERRAKEALECTQAALDSQPTSTMWVNFLEGDTRTAREARDRFDRLVEKKKMIDHLANS